MTQKIGERKALLRCQQIQRGAVEGRQFALEAPCSMDNHRGRWEPRFPKQNHLLCRDNAIRKLFYFTPAPLHLGEAICLGLVKVLCVELTKITSIPSPPKIDPVQFSPLTEDRDIPKMERDRIFECRAYGDNLNVSAKQKHPDKKAEALYSYYWTSLLWVCVAMVGMMVEWREMFVVIIKVLLLPFWCITPSGLNNSNFKRLSFLKNTITSIAMIEYQGKV